MSSKKKQQCRNPRLPNRFRSLVLISHIISYTRYPPPSLSIRRTRTRAWIAACYTGVAAPEDRLSVEGNIRATGEVLLGDDSPLSPQKTFSQLSFVPFHWLQQRRNEHVCPLQTNKQTLSISSRNCNHCVLTSTS